MESQRGPGWRIVSSTYPIATPFLRLRSDTIELPNGTLIENYYVRETHGFSVMFALTPDDDVVLVRQYKHGAGVDVLELPAGAMESGESPHDCAMRELAEETGYASDDVTHVRSFLADPTNSNGLFHLFVFRGVTKQFATKFDSTEDITVEFAKLADVRAMALDGRINSGSQVAAILVALAFLESVGA